MKSNRKAPIGQNFLTESSAAEEIVNALGDVSGSRVVEIGPGTGVLTDILAARARQVIAIELDRSLAAGLRFKYDGHPNVEIVEGDVLKVDFRELLGTTEALPTHILGNLPYYITTDILLRIFQVHELFDQIVIMVQREVADRIAAHPGTRDYGLLSVTAQLYTRAQKLFTLPPDAFSPPPKVHSAVVRMKVAPRFQELGVTAGEFIDFLKLAFGMKRKTLMNNLKRAYPEDHVRAALEVVGVRADVRAEAVGLEESAGIFRRLAKDDFTAKDAKGAKEK